MKNFKKIIIITTVTLFTGCACNTQSDSPTTKVETDVIEHSGLPLATQWILESFNEKGFQKNTKSSYININDDLKTYTGNAGCNTIRGEIIVKDDNIKFDKGIMTEMACDNLKQEDLFVKNLNKASKYKIIGGELFLYEGDNLLMTLESFR